MTRQGGRLSLSGTTQPGAIAPPEKRLYEIGWFYPRWVPHHMATDETGDTK